jgi:transcriptional regulator with XRE-family HTH domain
MSKFAERLRQRISSLGLSHAEVARRAGFDPRRFGHYATGFREPDFQTLLKICQVLSIDPNALLGVTEELQPKSSRSVLLERLITAGSLLDEDKLNIMLVQVNAVLELQNSQDEQAVDRSKVKSR